MTAEVNCYLWLRSISGIPINSTCGTRNFTWLCLIKVTRATPATSFPMLFYLHVHIVNYNGTMGHLIKWEMS